MEAEVFEFTQKRKLECTSDEGGYSSGQRGQTVNLLASGLQRFESSPTQYIKFRN